MSRQSMIFWCAAGWVLAAAPALGRRRQCRQIAIPGALQRLPYGGIGR